MPAGFPLTTDPPLLPSQVQAPPKSRQSTEPDIGPVPLTTFSENLEKSFKPEITVAMEKPKYCDPEDMVTFLLALCCQDDASPTPASRDKDLNKHFDACYNSVLPIANCVGLRGKLDAYKSSMSVYDLGIDLSFAGAMNYALERLSRVEVNGLPRFKSHITFVQCGRETQSDCGEPGLSTEPYLAVMSLHDAYELYELNRTGGLEPSTFINGLEEKSPSGSTSWETELLGVEIERNTNEVWPELGVFDPRVAMHDMGDSQPTNSMSSMNTVSPNLKRSATAAKLDTSGTTSSSKHRRLKENKTEEATDTLVTANKDYATWKFSDGSFSISHVLNLLVENNCLWISWIDREGMIVSSGFSFFKNLPLLLVLLLIFQRFRRGQWGYTSELSTENHSVLLHPVNAGGTLGKKKVVVNFFPDDMVHSTKSLFGRGTAVIGANRKDGGGRSTGGESVRIGVNDTEAYQGQNSDIRQTLEEGIERPVLYLTDASRSDKKRARAERWREFYQARHEYQKANAETIRSHNLVLKVSWPGALRLEEWRIIERAQTLGNVDNTIKGHVPEVKYARDFDRYSTDHIRCFLGFQQGRTSRTLTLRLIVTNRLWPIYDLDGDQFWTVFWQCVACHYRLWVNGIQHSDISPKNLMYDISTETGDPVGVLNDFDLAFWVGHSAKNGGRTGTVPYMPIDFLEAPPNHYIPRLYRHDLESFGWVLAYITIAKIYYEDCTIKISSPECSDAWFHFTADRLEHARAKYGFHSFYSRGRDVSPRYLRYLDTVQHITRYWSDFHESRRLLVPSGKSHQSPTVRKETAPSEQEVDNPAGSLGLFIDTVGESVTGEWLVVGDRLFEAIYTPVLVIGTVYK